MELNEVLCLTRISLFYTCRKTVQWRHNGCDGVSNHQPYDCLFNRLFKAQIKENIKAPRHWPLCGEFTGGPVNSPHKGPVTRKMFPFDDVIMWYGTGSVVSKTATSWTVNLYDDFLLPVTSGALQLTWFNFFPAWISNYLPCNVWMKLLISCTVEVWERICNFTPHFIVDVISYLYWD